MKNRFLVIIIFLCLLVAIGTIEYFVTPVVEAKEVVYEYGDSVSLDPMNYLDLSELSDVKQQQIINKIKIIEYNFDNLDCPSVGEYYLIIDYDGQNIEIKVEVKETEDFEFIEFKDSLEVIEGCFSKQEVIENYACDNEVLFDLEDDNVDYQTAGSYLANIVATNELGKILKKEIEIVVIKPTIELDVSKKSLEIGDSFSLDPTVTGNQDIIYTSSNSTVASVSSSGQVKALTAGSATIYVEANGITEECAITVSSTTASTNTTNNSSSSSSISATPYVSSSALELINQERVKLGITELTYSTTAKNVSFVRIKELVESFSHLRPNGQYVSSAYNELGYSIGATGECIGVGQTSASQIVARWQVSSSHWEALMNPKYQYGVVSYYQYDGKTYWIAELYAN
ncbi:CAP domain-containing protein [Tannockella kyphosi]|uniref:CAP domain-containing protein n=1 Tax=Tannockella kyphosi TaxID=2899121 RepID=UPI0020111F5D|nr:CAP domain-containing protein [Tannockella kyphosi]